MEALPDGWSEAFRDRAVAPCSDRALVLSSLDIPHQMLHLGGYCRLVVPDEFLERARFEIWQYEQENRPVAQVQPLFTPHYQDAWPGVIAYIALIGLFAWCAGVAAFNRDWLAAGRIDGLRLRDGEIWRAFTALTLHLDIRHLLGNMGFGGLFGFFAGRLLGPGVAWLTNGHAG